MLQLPAPPDGLSMDTALSEITIQTTLTDGPGHEWQDTVGGLGVLLFTVTMLPAGVASWLMSSADFARLTGPLCVALLVVCVLFAVTLIGRTRGPLVLRGNTLLAAGFPVQLDQIQRVTIRSTPIHKSSRLRYTLVLHVGRETLSWSLSRVTPEQAEWIAEAVRAAAAQARTQVGAPATVPAALRALRERR